MASPSLVLVLAAGEGTRMRSQTPKVLHPVLGRPMLGHVLHAASALNPEHTIVVTGSGRVEVEEWLSYAWPHVVAIEQAERRGTGHAVRVALEAFSERVQNLTGDVVVLTGDTPLLTGDALEKLFNEHHASGAATTVLTATLDNPNGYGRIVRDADGDVVGIVEHKDATSAELLISEINSGMYVFSVEPLRAALAQLTTTNSQGEEYLTDVLAIQRSAGFRVTASVLESAVEILGVNDRSQLADATRIMQSRINRTWMLAGVTITDPQSTWIETEAVIARDVTILPGCHIQGKTAIAEGAVVGPDSTLQDCTVDEGASVVRSHALGAHIGKEASVGPFSFLRPGAELHEKAKAGAYVEIKNSVIGRGSKVPHLSYVGDATIGTGSNIGAATVFVNYDGVQKHHTIVGDGVRIGSDTMLVAPVSIGDGAYTAAGSVITDDVPAGAMGVGRARQRNILGWVRHKRPGSASDKAAAQSNEDQETE